MKKALISMVSLVTFSVICNAQIENWYGVDLSKLGYRGNRLTFENGINGNMAAYAGAPFRTVTGGSWELSSEVYSKHVYFGINGSFLLDVGTVLFQFNDKERWYDNMEYTIERGELIPVQLAFGTNIGKYVAVYAGGQYQYTTFGINPRDEGQYRTVYIGGNQRGAGLHVIGAWKFVNVRYSYMHDWIRSAKTFEGMAYTHEFVVHLGLSQIGVFAKFNHVHREMFGGYLPSDRTERTQADLKDYALLPAEFGQQFSWSVGIYMQGLFSGVTQAGARAVGDVERGLRDERNQDKRGRIEWVE
jgi:hypothetical protein